MSIAELSDSLSSLLEEQRLTPSQAAKLIPVGRGGRPTATSTILRWATRGCRGVKLEAYRVGSLWYTSREAIERFLAALNDPACQPEPSAAAPVPTSRQHRASVRACESYCDSRNVG